jgi:hypothetical protein
VIEKILVHLGMFQGMSVSPPVRAPPGQGVLFE